MQHSQAFRSGRASAFILAGLMVCISGCGGCSPEPNGPAPEAPPTPEITTDGPAWDTLIAEYGTPDPKRLAALCNKSIGPMQEAAKLAASMKDEESARAALPRFVELTSASPINDYLARNYFSDSHYSHMKPELRDPLNQIRTRYIADYTRAEQEITREMTRALQNLDILVALAELPGGGLSGLGGGGLADLANLGKSSTVTIRFVDPPLGTLQLLKWQTTRLAGGYSSSKASEDADGRPVCTFTSTLPTGMTAEQLLPMAQDEIEYGHVALVDPTTIEVQCIAQQMPVPVASPPKSDAIDADPTLLTAALDAMIDCRSTQYLINASESLIGTTSLNAETTPELKTRFCDQYEQIVKQELAMPIRFDDYQRLVSGYLPLYLKLSDEQRPAVQTVLESTQDISDARFRVRLFEQLEKARPDDPGLIAGLFANLDIPEFRAAAIARGADVSQQMVDYLVINGKNDSPATRELASTVRRLCIDGEFDPASIPTLLEAVQKSSGTTGNALFEAIGNTGDESAVPLLISAYKKSQDRFGPNTLKLVAMLKKCGPAAEPSVLDIFTNSDDPGVWNQCIEILGVIGTSDSISALQAYAKKFGQSENGRNAQAAMSAIAAREGTELPETPGTGDAATDGSTDDTANGTTDGTGDNAGNVAGDIATEPDVAVDDDPAAEPDPASELGGAMGTQVDERLAGMSPPERYELAEKQTKQLGTWLYTLGEGLKTARDTAALAALTKKLKATAPASGAEREMVLRSLSGRQRQQLDADYNEKLEQVADTIGTEVARARQNGQLWQDIDPIRTMYRASTAGTSLKDPF